MENNSTYTAAPVSVDSSITLQREVAFSIMFVAVGMSCFIWQSITSGWMFYKARKPIIGLVFAQAVLGTVVTFLTLMTSLVDIDCTFRLVFSVVGVNLGDMSLQFILLWKAYLGNNRSKVILAIGFIPIVAIMIFIGVNMTVGKSKTYLDGGLCSTDYPTYIVIAKAVIDCTSNTFLSGCFILVIYRHYRILGSSIQKTLITEGLIYCFGVCLSNILTGILLVKNVIGGSSPILYTIDWYLASYLIIKQLGHSSPTNNVIDEDKEDDEDNISIESKPLDIEEDEEIYIRQCGKDRDTYYHSMDGTLVPSSPRSPCCCSDHEKYLAASLPVFEPKIFVSSAIKSFEAIQLNRNSSSTTEFISEEDITTVHQEYQRRYNTGDLPNLAIAQKSIVQNLDSTPKKYNNTFLINNMQ